MSPDAAVIRLASAGADIPSACLSPAAGAVYAQTVCGQRTAALAAWTAAADRGSTTPAQEIHRLRADHALRLDASPPRWLAGPGRYLGVAAAPAINALCAPRNPLKGKWGNVLAVPFFDMPERIAAFSVLGRQGRRPQDEAFVCLGECAAARGEGNAGLAGLPVALETELGTPIIALDDWLPAVQLQCVHARTSGKPLPVVIWADAGPGKARTRDTTWETLGNRPVIFWTRTPTAALVRQAMGCADGRITLLSPRDPGPSSLRRYLADYDNSTQSLYALLVAKARPWATALGQWLSTAADGEVNELLIKLDQQGTDVGYVLKRCQLLDTRQVPVPVRAVTVSGVRIVEDDHRWVIHARGERRGDVCNCILRLTHAIKDADTGAMFYAGHVLCQNRRAPFLVPLDVVRTRAADWLDRLLIDNNLGILQCHPRFKNRLHEIAVAFHEPEFVVDQLWKWAERLTP